jgi:hypothetical protein
MRVANAASDVILKGGNATGKVLMVAAAYNDGYSFGTELNKSMESGNYRNTAQEGTRIAGGWAGAAVGANVGSNVGRVAGMVVGGIIGSIIPVAGTGAGMAVGAAIGTVAGGLIGGAYGYLKGSNFATSTFNKLFK